MYGISSISAVEGAEERARSAGRRGRSRATPKIHSASAAVVPMIRLNSSWPRDVAEDGALHEQREVVVGRAVAARHHARARALPICSP